MNAPQAAYPPQPAYGQPFAPSQSVLYQQPGQQQPYYPGAIPQGQPPQHYPPSSNPGYSFASQGIHNDASIAPSGHQFQPVDPPAYSAPPYAQSIRPSALPSSQAPLQTSFSQAQPNSMAASAPAPPAVSNNPTPAQQRPPQGQMQAPLSPRSASREKARVTVLLDINSALLAEVVNLQGAGKAGVPTSQPQQSPTTEGPSASPTSAIDPSTGLQSSPADAKPNPLAPSKPPSQDYIDCMRRLQANLAYLATIADRQKKPGSNPPSAPAIMTPPPNLTAVKDLYAKLNELFAGVGKATGMAPQQKASNSQG